MTTCPESEATPALGRVTVTVVPITLNVTHSASTIISGGGGVPAPDGINRFNRYRSPRTGLKWLIEHQKKTGDLFTGGSHNAYMYSHGIATIALAELYGQTRDSSLRKKLDGDPKPKDCSKGRSNTRTATR